jgi:hypothetical protein
MKVMQTTTVDDQGGGKMPPIKRNQPTLKKPPQKGFGSKSVDLHEGIILDTLSSTAFDVSDTQLDMQAKLVSPYRSKNSQNSPNQASSESHFFEEGDPLKAFGIVPVVVGKNGSLLRCCVVHNTEGYSLVFRLEQSNGSAPGGTWAEKIFFDAIRDREAWVADLHFDTSCLSWYKENVAQMSVTKSGTYAIRMFVINALGAPPGEQQIFRLASYICKILSDKPSSRLPTTFVANDSFFWMKKPVWSEIIGETAALEMLARNHGPIGMGYYAQNADTVHTFFRQGSLSMEVARVIDAPLSQVHSSVASMDVGASTSSGEDE